MTDVAITGVGLITAQGGVADLAAAARAPVAMPWHAARRYRPLLGGAATGAARLAAAIQSALAGCGGSGPIVAASCNGAAASWSVEDWRASFELGLGPVASAACASGMHALYLARRLIAAGAPEVRVVAADIATAPGHDNFEALRLLSDEPAPFQPDASGFWLGEAAVALRLVPAATAPGAPRLIGPVLGHDVDGDDGIARALAALAAGPAAADPGSPGMPPGPRRSALGGVELVIGQGTGPAEADRAELAAIAAHIAPGVPLATALPGFGHTLGASSLLSVALAVLARDTEIPALAARHPAALDGRPLGARRSRRTVVVCRALGGACGACLITDVATAPVGSAGDARHRGLAIDPAPRPPVAGSADDAREPYPADDPVASGLHAPAPLTWRPPSTLPPLRDPVLRAIAAAAASHRPAAPPGLLVVTLDAPLPPSARIGRRILPTSVLEMTPGQLPQLIARAWGHPGPALCLVGGDPAALLAACRATHDRVYRVAIRGMDDRDVEWDA